MDSLIFFIILPVLDAAFTCEDVDNACADYGHDYICNGDYIPWSTAHCRKFCNFCPSEVPAYCMDADSNCTGYARDHICTGDYIPWSTRHCRKYCNLCLLGSIAINKTATQSSNYVEGNSVWSAHTAVDGDTTCGYPPTSQYYSATMSGMAQTSWWEVDLGKVYAVYQVIVNGMPRDLHNQLTGFRLYLTKQHVDNPDASTAVYNNTDYGNGTFNIQVSAEARYVMLTMTESYNAIVLCEVEVYGTEVSSNSTLFTTSIPTNESTTVTTELATAEYSTTETPAATSTTRTHFPRTSATVTATTATVISMCPKEVKQRVKSQYLFQLGENCYEFVPLNDSWIHAKEDCHNKGGYLLSIISADEQTFVSNMLTTINVTQQLWLGLDDRINEEQWEWNSGDPVHYINWIPGRYIDQYHDQEDCAVMDMSRGGQWDDADCNTVVSGGMLSYPWICQYVRQRQVPNSTVTVIGGGWSSWFYASCSVSCGTGTTHRVRTCSTGHSVDCTGMDFESVACDAGPCPIDGYWSSWQQWSTCSTTCDDGIQFRTRNCDNPLPQYGGTNCSGSGNETTPCHLIDCPPSWSSWFYGTCSVTCGPGTSGKLRRCSTGKEADCPGKAFEILSCDEGPCPIDGSWGSWQEWSTCSTTCGDGRRFRMRMCNNPAPQNNGLHCSGSINETSPCNHGECPHWLPFYETSMCSTTCGAGFFQLRRNCSSGKPRDCHGSEYGEKPCNLMDCSS
ncbi:uncharacterized protein LOC123559120 isoform X2 [Mercenaria mercenaria]|uniref:uncharacterized protein LOC123559120 isoform X2 n=1 Tax=Mercenaria mercenaria TaxID=6596 RepID=UPI00234F37B9|nr:uncharacterized protein LOC123559120 isoform X2 [Mercenaria mercenaria]